MLFKKAGLACCAVLAAWLATTAGQAPASEGKKADAAVAAYINGEPITLAELDEIAIGKNMKLAQQLYDARSSALDQLILNRALAKEAEAAGMSVDDYIAKRVAEKVTPVTDAEVESFYNSNKSRMGNRTLDQMRDRIKSYLEGNRQKEARDALIQEIKSKQKIKIVLDAPRVKMEVAANEPSKGPANAKVTIVEYSEFQ